MWLVVGLGNPGLSYRYSRHNVGFQVADHLTRHCDVPWQQQFEGHLRRLSLSGAPAVVLKPQTYMNRSGLSVGPALAATGIALEQTVVIHDDLDLPFSQIRLKAGGGHGGHRGLRSIADEVGSAFLRVRIGIGRPTGEVTPFVLGAFEAEEQNQLPTLLGRAADAVEAILSHGLARAANTFNVRPRAWRAALDDQNDDVQAAVTVGKEEEEG